ncbi:sugar-phosphatase [Mycetocola sp. CAN_C7]|uniref:HAD-IA family hydrolase n=1 Tax=Mycetocola sp. CAN_C7 TaxID=2787724 RepID=UPI0018CB3029
MPETSIVCRAILFDLDGVLVNSLDSIERILREWATEHGLDGDEAVALSPGRRDIDIIRVLAPHLDAELATQEIVARERMDFSGLTTLPRTAELLNGLPSDSWAIVTSGTRTVAEGRLRAVGLPIPRVFVTAGDVTDGKPHPDGYLAAARMLGVAPEDAVVIEDAVAGAEAARAAAMRCIGVGDAFPGADSLAARVSGVDQLVVTSGPGGLTITLPAQRNG